jgi:putative ubiquitin-RnfH superfamily antitoxin RatB of RatAB toxin-antitoxin module
VRVEVVFAMADAPDIAVLDLNEGAVARDAVTASGVIARHRQSAGKLVLGIAGRRVAPEHRLREGDRVEILRPLAAEPNEARRQRARRGR